MNSSLPSLGLHYSHVRKCSPTKYLGFYNRLPSAMYFDLKATESSSMRQSLVISDKEGNSFGVISDSICPAAAVVGHPGVAHATKSHQPPTLAGPGRRVTGGRSTCFLGFPESPLEKDSPIGGWAFLSRVWGHRAERQEGVS